MKSKKTAKTVIIIILLILLMPIPVKRKDGEFNIEYTKQKRK